MEVKGWLIKVGHQFKFTRRDYKVYYGTLGKVHFEPKLLELDCVVYEKDYIKRKMIVEVETMTIALSQLINFEEVFEHDEIDLDKDMMPIEEGEQIPEVSEYLS